MRFLKIKAMCEDGKDKVYLEWEVPNGSDFDHFMLKSNDKPAPEFHEALQALAQDMVEMCELSDDDKDRVMVRSVSLNYGGEKQVMGATISGFKKLMKSNAPLNLNTPNKAEDFYAETGDPKQLLDPQCVERLRHLIDCAEDFRAGVRAQVSMQLQGVGA